MFQGFPKETVKFLKALRANNTKEWFENHRADYDEYYVKPAVELINALTPVAEALDPPHQGIAKINKSLRRIHRDTRFAKDKTPYNTSMHIEFWTGDHPNKSAGTHLVLSHEHFGFGAGHWAFEGEGLDRYRAAVQTKSEMSALKEALESAASVGCVPGEPALKKVPRGFDADSPAAAFLRRKGIVVMSQQRDGFDDRVFGPDAVAFMTEILTAVAPLNGWIRRVVD
ncbi:MAG: DUF2461 domain-containing protein [Alphaproteobacteria bacterium]|nr:DUF2461 domain-containing protein [Alphaproteobacteria bacterium]